jgi:beta-galactosidase/beta-glucuronidase
MDHSGFNTSDIPRPEYPRPQFVRDTWMNLNGQWDFLFDFGNSGMDRRLWQDDELDKAMRSSAMPVVITVPFCPESRLSGIGYTDWIAAVWYRRRFRLDASQTAGRVLLPFGAIDYHSVIWINGAKAGEHKGGYASFELDVTALVTNGENTVVVYAQDDNRSGIQPCGKQARLYYSNGCDYTRTTGIWRTVWLEFTPREALTYIRITPDVASEAALLDIETVGGHAVEAVASYNGCEVGRACVPLTGGRAHLELRLAQLHLWELGKPELYDLTASLDTGDTVRSYFGMRSVSLSDTALLLNGRPVFMRTVKDQGFNRLRRRTQRRGAADKVSGVARDRGRLLARQRRKGDRVQQAYDRGGQMPRHGGQRIRASRIVRQYRACHGV